MNRFAALAETPDVTLVSFDHPAGVHQDPEFEVASTDCISFVDGGHFDVCFDGRRSRLAPGSLFLTTRGMSFSCTHDCEAPTDRCLSVSYGAAAVDDLHSAGVPPLQPPDAVVSYRQHYIAHRLRSCVPGDEVRLELLAGALYESLADERGSRRIPAVGSSTHLMRCVDRAIDLIEVEYGRTLTLRDLALAAGLSTFHFARVFRELTGLPPHRYLTAVRLRHAARLLEQGASVSASSLDAGFGSLSHFITAFRKRFGFPPSLVRRRGRQPALRAALAAPMWTRGPAHSGEN
jgi:AraC-like DNA-binding protein